MARLANMQQGRIAMPKLDLAPKLGGLETFDRDRTSENASPPPSFTNSSSRKVKPALSAVRTPCRIGTTEA